MGIQDLPEKIKLGNPGCIDVVQVLVDLRAGRGVFMVEELVKADQKYHPFPVLHMAFGSGAVVDDGV